MATARTPCLGPALASLLVLGTAPTALASDDGQADEALFRTIAALDTAVFDAFNHCSDPAQLKKHEGYFTEDMEFYHDQNGVTWARKDFIDSTRKNVCGNFGRELVPGSLRVYPIKDYGAIETGAHRFCHFDTGKCEGMADFTLIWRHKDGGWQITRALSYGHRSGDAPKPEGQPAPQH